MSAISLRLAPTRNNQMLKIRWARDYEFETSLRRHWDVGSEDSEQDEIAQLKTLR